MCAHSPQQIPTPLAWTVSVFAGEDQCPQFTITRATQDEAETTAGDLRAAYAQIAATPHHTGWSDVEVVVEPVTLDEAARPVARYAAAVAPVPESALRMRMFPTMHATVEMIPDGETPDWAEQMQVQAQPGKHGGFMIFGTDPVAVRAEQARLWAIANPDAPPLPQ